MATNEGRVTDEAFITLATNDVYARGALVLAESLKKRGTTRQIVVMITPQVSPPIRSALGCVFDVVRLVDVLDSEDAAHLACLKRPELGITFTKIHCWTFTEYRKCVFMDADMMVLQNIDDLFEREELSAAPDSGWPDIFNSGLFVFRPSLETFNNLLLLSDNEGSFDGGDQGLLNTYFNNWARSDISRHLPFLYNLHVSASYQYLPAFKRFGKDTKVVHFLGPVKPWHHSFNKATGQVQEVSGTSQSGVRHFPQYLNEWWAIYNEKVQKYFPQQGEIGGRKIFGQTEHSTYNGTSYQEQGDEEPYEWHAVSETWDHEHHEAHSHHEQSEPPSPFHWELPDTFFKSQPEPYSHPEVSITDVGVKENHESGRSAGILHGDPNIVVPHTECQITPIEKGNAYTLPSTEASGDGPDVLHGDPNVVVQPTEYQFTPIEKENAFAQPSTEDGGDDHNEMDSYVESDLESLGSTVALTTGRSTPSSAEVTGHSTPSSVEFTGLSTPSSVESESLMMAEFDTAQGTSSHDITLTPPQSPTNVLTTALPQTEEEIERAKMAHMEAWQRGEIDYMGRDRFANIQAALDAFLL